MLANILTATLLPLFASATPLLTSRAGGPSAVAIPANCTTLNSLPHANCGIANVDGYAPSVAFSEANLVYSSYYSTADSVADAANFCFEQCYGFGNTGDCKSAVIAYNVPTPKGYYGTDGGVLETACLMYSAHLTPNDFVLVDQPGQWANATSASIYCPSSS